MKRVIFIVVAVVMLSVGTVHSQQPAQLTEVEKLKLENMQLKMQVAQYQFRDLQQQYQQITVQVGQAHPGYMLDQQGNLVAAPKPPKEVKPETPKK